MARQELTGLRESLRLSQAQLARLSQVPRWKICLFEAGDGELTSGEHRAIASALEQERQRLAALPPIEEHVEASA